MKSQHVKFFPMKMYRVFSSAYILSAPQTTQSLDHTYSDHFLACSKDTWAEWHITPHLLFDLSHKSFLVMLSYFQACPTKKQTDGCKGDLIQALFMHRVSLLCCFIYMKPAHCVCVLSVFRYSILHIFILDFQSNLLELDV